MIQTTCYIVLNEFSRNQCGSIWATGLLKGLFTCLIKVTVFVSDIFYGFNILKVMWEHHHRNMTVLDCPHFRTITNDLLPQV